MKSESDWKSWLFLYPLLQGLGGVGWWCLLLAVPESRALFLSETLSERVLLAFWLPDGVVFVGGSFVLAYGLWRQRCWAGRISRNTVSACTPARCAGGSAGRISLRSDWLCLPTP